MRVAVFTNQFPSRLSTFFARDMRALLDAGLELDIYPIYPLDGALWRYVPAELDEHVLPRSQVHHLPLRSVLGSARLGDAEGRSLPSFARDSARAGLAAARFGIESLTKTGYAALKAWGWSSRAKRPDHVLAYWGNYAATAAYLFHRAIVPDVPFSMFVHARMDLYRKPAFLVAKMLHADNVFLVCEFNRLYIAEHYPDDFPRIADRLRIHHLGLDLDAVRYAPGNRPACRLVGVGRQEPLKGYHVLLDALAALRARGIPAELELVGGGPQHAALRRQAARLGLDDVVQFSGWLKPEQTMEAIRRATILVHPSVSLDAMPTVLKEALAVGTPVVASRLAGIPEIVDNGRCGMLVPPDDRAALTDALSTLITDTDLRRRYADAGRAHAVRLFDAPRNGRLLATRLRETRRHQRAPTALLSALTSGIGQE